MKRLVAFVLTASLLISCVSASAVEWTPVDSTNLNNIRVYTDIIMGRIGSVNLSNSVLYFLSYLPNVSGQLNSVSSLSSDIQKALGDKFSYDSGTINGRLYDIYNQLRTGVPLSLPNAGLTVDLGFPSGKTFFEPGIQVWGISNSLDVVGTTWSSWLSYMSRYTAMSANIFNHPYLNVAGLDGASGNYPTSAVVASSFLGLARILRGSSGASVSGNVLSSADLSQTSFSANNLLSMLSVLLPIQNDLAKVANVIADPMDQKLNDANKDNKQAVVDNFTGDAGGVSPSNIGSVSDLSGTVSSSFDTSVSAGDFVTQFSSDERFSLFSQETADDVDSVASTYAYDDDFIDFYDPDNKALWDLIEQGGGE